MVTLLIVNHSWKSRRKTKTESLFDIDIMTLQGAEKKQLGVAVLDGVERSHSIVNTSTTESGMCGVNLISPPKKCDFR